MAQTSTTARRPAASADHRARTKHAAWGIGLGIIGLLLATVTLIANVVAGNLALQGAGTRVAGLEAWSFGLTTLGFGTVKVGIAVVLIGILARLWLRVESVKAALPDLRPEGAGDTPVRSGTVETPYGRATVSATEPEPLPIHRMAQRMWIPSLVMGAMLVAIGFIVSLVQAGRVATDPVGAVSLSAWTQGVQFLGEGFLLVGIAFLLGTILAALRSGGGEVQASLGLPVKVLEMPAAAKAFVGLMMLGLVVEVVQFIGYIVAANATPAVAEVLFTWLGPLREAGLGLILAGITLALATIAKGLGFQFDRIAEIITTGT